jgi:DNA repair protein RecO (recombination protein O)
MFINEILNKTVKEESHALEQFEFMLESLISLDDRKKGFENFHLIFLIKLSRFLGFGAHHADEVLSGRLTGKEEEELLKKLIVAEYGDTFVITQEQRRALLEILLRFYSSHIDSLGEIRSVQVLKEVMG